MPLETQQTPASIGVIKDVARKIYSLTQEYKPKKDEAPFQLTPKKLSTVKGCRDVLGGVMLAEKQPDVLHTSSTMNIPLELEGLTFIDNKELPVQVHDEIHEGRFEGIPEGGALFRVKYDQKTKVLTFNSSVGEEIEVISSADESFTLNIALRRIEAKPDEQGKYPAQYILLKPKGASDNKGYKLEAQPVTEDDRIFLKIRVLGQPDQLFESVMGQESPEKMALETQPTPASVGAIKSVLQQAYSLVKKRESHKGNERLTPEELSTVAAFRNMLGDVMLEEKQPALLHVGSTINIPLKLGELTFIDNEKLPVQVHGEVREGRFDGIPEGSNLLQVKCDQTTQVLTFKSNAGEETEVISGLDEGFHANTPLKQRIRVEPDEQRKYPAQYILLKPKGASDNQGYKLEAQPVTEGDQILLKIRVLGQPDQLFESVMEHKRVSEGDSIENDMDDVHGF